MRTEYAQHLNLHEKLFLLGLARTLERTQEGYTSMGDAEIAYRMACEEYREESRAHTQVWKYVQNLAASGIVSTKPSAAGFRGKTTMLGLPTAPASAIKRWLESSIVRRF
jgi:Cdc6-like AAA superfamily ATPase